MGRRKKFHKPDTLALAFVFVGFVLALVVVSVFLKGAILLKTSLFDGQHRFTIAIPLGKENKTAEIISISPADQSVSRLTISAGIGPLGMERFLEIPIDGTIVQSSHFFEKGELDDTFKQLVIDFGGLRTNLTILDVIRIWWANHSISHHSVEDIDFHSASDISMSAQMDTLVQKLFSDSAISSEKQSISIINGTDISGFGNRLARLITNMGGNVVSVATSDQQIESTKIAYQGSKSYTVGKIEKILNVKAVRSKEAYFANIVVTLGEDKRNTLAF